MTTTTATTTTSIYPTTQRGRTAQTAAVTTFAAVTANLAVFALARARDVNFEFPKPGSGTGTQTVNAGMVLVVTMTAMIVGWVIVGLTARHHRPTLGTLAIIGGIFAAVSTIGPLTLDAGLSVKLSLASMHLIAGSFYVAGVASLRRTNAGASQ